MGMMGEEVGRLIEGMGEVGGEVESLGEGLRKEKERVKEMREEVWVWREEMGKGSERI